MSAAASAAAEWWATRLQRPGYPDCTLDPAEAAEVREAVDFARSLGGGAGVGPEDAEKFSTVLAAEIDHELRSRSSFVFGTDYGPGWFLAAVAHCAGVKVPSGAWPAKTMMEVDGAAGQVRVSDGFGSEYRTVAG